MKLITNRDQAEAVLHYTNFFMMTLGAGVAAFLSIMLVADVWTFLINDHLTVGEVGFGMVMKLIFILHFGGCGVSGAGGLQRLRQEQREREERSKPGAYEAYMGGDYS